jgi:regulator of protease activity HflC (stomatin/prohibitin superfamily)
LRLKFGQPRPEDKGTPLGEDPYNIAMVAEVVPVVSWHITDATTFFKVMGSVQNCRKVMTDKAIGVFGNKFSKVTPARAALSLFRISNDLEQTLKAETATWGVTIDDAYVKPFIFSHGLNKAVVGVEEARQNAKSARETAYGTRDKLKAEGDGAAHARRVMLLAEAIGITKLAEVSKTPEGQMTLWMETMKKAFERAQYSIVPGSEMFTAFAGISEAVKKIKTGGA